MLRWIPYDLQNSSLICGEIKTQDYQLLYRYSQLPVNMCSDNMISKLRGLKFIEIYSVSVKCSKIRGLRREGVRQLTLPTHPTVVTSLMRRRFVYMNKFMLLSLPIVLYK